MLNKLYIYQTQNIQEEQFISILNGKIISFNIDKAILINTNLQYYSYLNKIINIEYIYTFKDIFDIFKHFIDGYIICNKNDNLYDIINKITLDSRFILVAFNDEHINLFKSNSISLFNNLNNNYTFNTKSIIYQDPNKNPSGLIDIAIAYKYKMTWTKYPIFNTKFKYLYGWSSTLCNCIPLEYMMVQNTSKSDAYVFPSDGHNNLAILYILNDKIIAKTKTIYKYNLSDNIFTKNKHYISLVYTDGDNFNVSYFRMNNYLDNNERKFPITWTIPLNAPKIYLKRLFDKANDFDEFIAGPSGYGYCFPNLLSTNGLKTHYNITDNLLSEFNIKIVNEIHKRDVQGLFNLLGFFCNCTCPYNTYNYAQTNSYKNSNILIYDAWNYCLNQNPYFGHNNNKIFFANKSLYFDRDISNIFKQQFPDNSYSIIPVNLWKFNIESLTIIVNQLSSKYPNIEFVNLSTIMDNFRYM